MEVPWLIGMHCIVHSLELSVLDALKDEQQLRNIEEMLQDLYKHYQYSLKPNMNSRNLHKYMMTFTPRGTQWLPHINRALTVMKSSVIHAHFKNTITVNNER